MERALSAMSSAARELLSLLIAILYLPAAQAPTAIITVWRLR